jgi:probable rRNA maturation factor
MNLNDKVMVINFYNKTKLKLVLKQKDLIGLIKKVVQELKISSNFEMTVLMVGDKEIRTLNKKYRQKDKVTDVLSFGQRGGGKIILPKEKNLYLGDIIICYPQIKRQAKKFGHTLAQEFTLLSIHGFLHLVGFDDDTQKGWKKMEKIQNKILAKI